jgi:hypothetical protein
MSSVDRINLRLARQEARQEIVDLSLKYSRACDRLDKELLESVYWPDGSDDHGIFKGSAPDYIDWVMGFLAQWTSSHHTNSNHLVEIDGDDAAGECHWIGFYRYEVDGQPIDQLSAGRYLDRYQRRSSDSETGGESGGEWRILHRTCTTEWSRVDVVDNDWRANPGPSIIGVRDRSDLVYHLSGLGPGAG